STGPGRRSGSPFVWVPSAAVSLQPRVRPRPPGRVWNPSPTNLLTSPRRKTRTTPIPPEGVMTAATSGTLCSAPPLPSSTLRPPTLPTLLLLPKVLQGPPPLLVS
ncbi:hypothetical protein Hamer_G004664, partial [Homarus americanus]